jgi:hypothetical protein
VRINLNSFIPAKLVIAMFGNANFMQFRMIINKLEEE